MSIEFYERMITGDIEYTLEFLLINNKGAEQKTNSRTVILMDATGSMYWLLALTKQTIGKMFERAAKILEEHGIIQRAF